MSKFKEIDFHITEILEKYIANPLIDEINETGAGYQLDTERCISRETGAEFVRFSIYNQEGGRVGCIARDLPPYKTIRLHRNPTQSEIKRGYGAIHYLDYPLQLLQKKGGGLKKWTVSRFDGLRYYR